MTYKEIIEKYKDLMVNAEDYVVSACAGLAVYMIGHFRHKRIIDAGEHKPQKLGAFHDHGSCDGVCGIIHLFADLYDAFTGLLADLRTS